ncbi:MAG: YidC/Oxa1 family membrane protein insertase [Prevotella sp.]|nr:YidC/Oxa1 family membrane protein insertase [Prevotella sp.]
MAWFDFIITQPILWVIQFCYRIIPNYVGALILFTLLVKLVLFPFSFWSQVQSVKMAKIKPQLDDIKAYHSDDWRVLMREQKKLYRQEHYHSLVSLLPLLLQIPIIVGVIRGLEDANILAAVPTLSQFYIPLLAAVSAFALCYVQNLCNVLAKAMGFFSKWGLAIFLTLLSLYFGLTCGVGFNIYWIAGNVLAIGIQLLCNVLYNPKKYLTYTVMPRPKKDRALIKRQKARERVDMKKFATTKKYLVFYSEKSGFYKYFQGAINYVLNHSKIHVHYLTSDVDDQVFQIDHPRFHAYYCGPHKLIVTMMKLNCRVMVMTLPDLDKYQYKRSIVNKNIEYIYLDHALASLSLQYRKNAFDAYDTICCYGPTYNQDVRAIEKFYGTKAKNLVNTGYPLFNQLLNSYHPHKPAQKTAIIAPSWQKDNILESCLAPLMAQLKAADYRVILRPHPEFIKRFPQKIAALQAQYPNALQLDFAVNVLDADLLITDWSSIAFEYSYATNKPTLFINTPMKILNPDWDQYGVEPLEITLRHQIGVALNPDQLDTFPQALTQMATIKAPRQIIQSYMYDSTQADAATGEYIIRSVKGK